jgi:murein DD-endopeptidase MepM/ murein hydrolase activator NlpD
MPVDRLQVLVALKRRNRFLSLSVPTYALVLAGILLAGLVVLSGLAFVRTGDSARLARLIRENASLREQVQHYTAAADTFRRFLVAAEQMDNKLRAAVSLSLIPGDLRLMGIGGSEPFSAELRVDNLLRRVRLEQQSLAEIESAIESQQARLANLPSIWPVLGWVASGFGSRRDPFTGARAQHPGLDIVAPAGTDIVASAEGRVAYSGWKPGWGRCVEIDHGYGIRTFYGHCRSLKAATGARVKRGQSIATVGSSGRSTGVHLHYGIRLNGNWVNPQNYLISELAAN